MAAPPTLPLKDTAYYRAEAARRGEESRAGFERMLFEAKAGLAGDMAANAGALAFLFGVQQDKIKPAELAGQWVETGKVQVGNESYDYSRLQEKAKQQFAALNNSKKQETLLKLFGAKTPEDIVKNKLPRSEALAEAAAIVGEEAQKEADRKRNEPWYMKLYDMLRVAVAYIAHFIGGLFGRNENQGAWDKIYAESGRKAAAAADERIQAKPELAQVFTGERRQQMRYGMVDGFLAAARGGAPAPVPQGKAAEAAIAERIRDIKSAPLGANLPDIGMLKISLAAKLRDQLPGMIRAGAKAQKESAAAEQETSIIARLGGWLRSFAGADPATMKQEDIEKLIHAELDKPNARSVARKEVLIDATAQAVIDTLREKARKGENVLGLLSNKKALAEAVAPAVTAALNQRKGEWGGMDHGLDEEIPKLVPQQIGAFINSSEYDALVKPYRDALSRAPGITRDDTSLAKEVDMESLGRLPPRAPGKAKPPQAIQASPSMYG